MKYLDLYPYPQLAEVETVPGRNINKKCDLCPLHESNKNVCISAEGDSGGLLVIGDHPFNTESSRDRPFVSSTGIKLRRLLQKHWKGPLALDYAIRCSPGKSTKIGDKHISACRSYLAKTISDVKPSRIITTGTIAMKSVLGRGVGSLSCRKGFSWLENSKVPVFTLMGGYFSLGNRFLHEWFEEDLRWALTADIDSLRQQSSRNGCAVIIENEEDALATVGSLVNCDWVSYDVETVGRAFNNDFEIISLAVSGKGMEDAYVWSGDSLSDSKIMRPILELLADNSVKVIAQNAKYDATAIYSYFGKHVNGLTIDTRLVRKILEPESLASLDVMQEICGMGGGKGIAKEAIKSITRRISRAKSDEELSLVGPIEWTKPIATKKYSAGAYAYGLIDTVVRDRYCARDAVSTARLGEIFEERIHKEKGLLTVWNEIMLPAAKAIEHVEQWGVHVDKEMASNFATSVQTDIERVRIELLKDGEFNLNSTKEMQEFLYLQIGLL